MKRWHLLLFAPLFCAPLAVAACGDDAGGGDQPDSGGGGLTDSPANTDAPQPPIDGGKDAADGSVDLASFPKYVKSLIETKTDDKGIPDKEAVWGTIPDDDKFVFLPTFFP